MATFFLEVGEAGTDRLNLSDEVNYMVMPNGFAVQDDAENDRYQIVMLPLSISGVTKDAMFNARRAILTKLRQAETGAQAASPHPFVTLGVQFSGATTMVRWYVTEGTLTAGSMESVFGNRIGNQTEPSMLTLRVLKGALGPAIEYGPFTVTGASPTLHIDGIPGDMAALAEVRVVDQSTNGAVVNRLRWACRSLVDLASGAFNPVLDLGGEGVDTNTFNGAYSSIGGTDEWQTIGSVTRAASAVSGGLYDIYARVRDGGFFAPSPSGVLAAASDAISRRQVQTATSSVNGTLVNISWTNPTLDGSLLVLAVRHGQDVVVTPPGGWVLATGIARTAGPSVSLFYKANAAVEAGVVGVQFSANTSFGSVILAEYRGIATVNPLDVTATNIATNVNNATTGATGLMAQNHGLALALHGTIERTAEERSADWDTVITPNRTLLSSRTVTDGASQSLIGYDTIGQTDNWAALIVVFKAADLAPASMPVGTYTVQITGIDAAGMESGSSAPVAVTLSAIGALQLDWIQATGAVNHRVYWKRDSQAWKYKVTGSDDGNYKLTSETGAITADPPAQSAIQTAQFRLQIGPESGATVDLNTVPINAQIANDEWETGSMARAYLPPAPLPLSAGATGYRVAVQGISSSSAQLSVDALVLMPADEQQMDAQYTENTLATLREWVIGTTPHMRSYGFLRAIAGGVEAGRLKTLGYALLGPGDTTMVFLPTVSGNVWNISDVSLSVSVVVRPRYEFLVGTI